MFYVGPCPICGNGLRGVRICCGQAVVVCDECDALWASPNLADRIAASSEPPCGQCGQSLWGDQAHWATRTEIEAAGWWPQVEGELPRRPTPDVAQASDAAVHRVTATQVSSGSLVVILALLLAGAVVASFAVL